MRLQEAKRQLKNHLLSEVADEVNARREEKQESEEQAVVIKGTDADQSGQTIKGFKITNRYNMRVRCCDEGTGEWQ